MFAFFSRPYYGYVCVRFTKEEQKDTNEQGSNNRSKYLLNLLVLRSRLQHGRDVVGETESLERLRDVITGDGLLRLLLGDLVRLRRDERDELDAEIDEEIPCFLGE